MPTSPRRGRMRYGGWADVYPQGAGRIRNAPTSRTAALGIGPYGVARKGLDIFGKSDILNIQGCYRQTGGSPDSYKEVTAGLQAGRLLLFVIGLYEEANNADYQDTDLN